MNEEDFFKYCNRGEWFIYGFMSGMIATLIIVIVYTVLFYS